MGITKVIKNRPVYINKKVYAMLLDLQHKLTHEDYRPTQKELVEKAVLEFIAMQKD